MVFYVLGNEASVLAERIRSLNPTQVVAFHKRPGTWEKMAFFTSKEHTGHSFEPTL